MKSHGKRFLHPVQVADSVRVHMVAMRNLDPKFKMLVLDAYGRKLIENVFIKIFKIFAFHGLSGRFLTVNKDIQCVLHCWRWICIRASMDALFSNAEQFRSHGAFVQSLQLPRFKFS